MRSGEILPEPERLAVRNDELHFRPSPSELDSQPVRFLRICAVPQTPRRLRSSPTAVLGPVLLPPCIRQRPLAIAGPHHFVPLCGRAPHRRAARKSPDGFPFFKVPRRWAGS